MCGFWPNWHRKVGGSLKIKILSIETVQQNWSQSEKVGVKYMYSKFGVNKNFAVAWYEPRNGKTCFSHMRTTGADQLVHPCSLVSTFVTHYLHVDSIIPLVSINEISSLYLSSVVEQTGLCRTGSQTSKTDFLITGPDSSVGRVSAPGNGRSRVRSRAATYQSHKNGTSCSSLGTQTYWVELRTGWPSVGIMWLGVVSCQVSGTWFFSEAAL